MSEWRWNELTKRQKQVVLLVVEGRLNRFGIGRELGITRTTVSVHLSAACKKLGIRFGRAQLAFEVGRHWKEIELEQDDIFEHYMAGGVNLYL